MAAMDGTGLMGIGPMTAGAMDWCIPYFCGLGTLHSFSLPWGLWRGDGFDFRRVSPVLALHRNGLGRFGPPRGIWGILASCGLSNGLDSRSFLPLGFWSVATARGSVA